MTASAVAPYLAALPADRRAALSAVRKVINENLPDGCEEGMQFGMIGWYVPLSLYPAGYGENPKVPLPLVALAPSRRTTAVSQHFSFSAFQHFRRAHGQLPGSENETGKRKFRKRSRTGQQRQEIHAEKGETELSVER